MPDAHGRRATGQRLPRGKHGLSRAFVASNQRERIIDSLAEVCVAKGYSAVTVEDIIADAGVSRRTFYDLFSDKQECFLLAYQLVMDRLFAAIEAAYEAGGSEWPERVARGLKAALDLFAAEPVLARLALVEVLAAGREAVRRRDTELTRFEVFFRPGGAELPLSLADQRLLLRAVVGGLSESLYARIVADDPKRLPEIAPDLVYCALVPYVGHVKAMATRAELRD